MTAPKIGFDDVFYYKGDDEQSAGWYFWDVDGLESHGPYQDERTAENALDTFLAEIDQENDR